MRKDFDRLGDILEAIEAIQRHLDGGKKAFDEDELIRVWCLRHLEVIGEAASRLSEDLYSRYPEIPWREMVGMRNVLIHGYFDIDWEEVWFAASRDIPALYASVKKILDQEDG